MSQKQLLANLCKQIGSKIPTWTQGTGGNVSIKEAHSLWIKASGERLDAVTATEGLAQIDLKKFRSILKKLGANLSEDQYSNLLQSSGERSSKPPSMEAGFHAILPKKWVAHFHSLAAILMVHTQNLNTVRWTSWLQNNSQGLDLRILPILSPGCQLMQAIRKDKNADIYLLKNHGVILHFEDLQIFELWKIFELKFCTDWAHPVLSQLLTSPTSEMHLKNQLRSYPPIPMKIYFPDAAVFEDQLMKNLTEIKDDIFSTYILNESCFTQNRNLAEIWAGSVILYQSDPSLSELSQELSRQIFELPSEKIRRTKSLIS
jgi:ribulose-5-phosphate 4-epimerase/fuculose-1-phosphate aldolase